MTSWQFECICLPFCWKRRTENDLTGHYRVVHFLNTIFWIFPLFCALQVFISEANAPWKDSEVRAVASLLTGSRVVVKAGVIEEFIQMDTDFLNNHLNASIPLRMSLCIPGAGITNSNPLIGALFMHSFTPKIFSERLQHVRHLSRYWRYNSERNK